MQFNQHFTGSNKSSYNILSSSVFTQQTGWYEKILQRLRNRAGLLFLGLCLVILKLGIGCLLIIKFIMTHCIRSR